MTSYSQHNFIFSTIKMESEYSPLRFILLLSKKKCCWCTQNYLWDIWWNYYNY